ncbi:PGF-CTERM sorting domain-containing protein [Salinigranum marinum]|uniref:PGF-CTERM sorting domain-containing protein n=1 Tax=Salinigranum marinum TaxID=1515595 RepID=UPI002989A2F7|nr:PGF-CTERM sorting domain-containing protein [Salinigranum marinum]
MSSTATKLQVLALTTLLVSSVFAGSITFAGTASALVTGAVTAESASDVQAYRTASTQTVVGTVTVTNGSSGNTVAVDVPDGNIVSATGVSVDNADVSASDLSVDSPTRVTVGLADTNAGDGADETVRVTVTVTHNLANVGPTAGLDATISAGGRSDTTQFDVVRYVGPTGPVGRVFLGDRGVDLTGIDDIPDAGGVTLFGVAGDADGGIANVGDVRRADITEANDFQPGGYSFTEPDGSVGLSVVEPRITEATLYRGNGTSGADVTGGSIPITIDALTLAVEFNFADAEDVEVTVTDEDGIDVTRQLTSTNRISQSGGTLVLTGVGELDPGDYTIEVEGADDLDDVRLTVGAGVRDEAQTISLDESAVTQGETVVATVRGSPGEYGLVRIDAADLDALAATDENAERVFAATGDVQSLVGTDTLGGTTEVAVGAVVDLDDEGKAQVRIDTAFLGATTVDVEFVELDAPNTDPGTLRAGFDASADDSVELDVDERELVFTDDLGIVQIGEEFVLEGTAPESDDVKAYARIDDEWVPLRDDDGSLAEDAVDSQGRFSVEIDSGQVIDIPDTYRIAIVADPVADGTNYIGSDESISTDVYSEFDTATTTTVRTAEGELTSNVSSSSIAADVGDEVVLSGTAFGQGDSVRVYLVGPRGQFLTADGGFGAETVSVDDNEFEEEYATFEQRGQYTFFVVGQGRDGEYGSDIGFGGELRRGLTPQQAVEIVRDEYSGAGVDDPVVEHSVVAENPSISIDEFGENGQVLAEELTVSGASNREDGTLVFVEVVDADDEVVATGEAEVDGSTNQWETTVELSGVETGTYTLRASDDETDASVEFEVVDELTTPAETPADTSTETETAAPTDTPTDTGTDTPTTTESPTTSTEFPGFGVVVALAALLVAFLLALRRD